MSSHNQQTTQSVFVDFDKDIVLLQKNPPQIQARLGNMKKIVRIQYFKTLYIKRDAEGG